MSQSTSSVPSSVVHVVAWEPRTPGEGDGGFNWFLNPAVADAEYATEQRHSARHGDRHLVLRFDAQVTSTARATEEIDAAWREWASFPGQPQPVDLRA